MQPHLRFFIRRPLFWSVTLAVTLAGATVSMRSALIDPVLGNRTTAAIVGSVQLLGPVALGAGAAIAVAVRKQGLGALHRLSPRGATARAWSVAIVTSPFVLGYLMGALVTAAWTAHLGSFGSLDWTGIASGALATAIHAVVGYLVGTWLPYRLTPGVAAIGVYLLEVYTVDLYGTQAYLLQPLLVQLVTAFWGFQPHLFIKQAIWFTALLAILLALAIGLSRSRLAALALVAVLASVPLWRLHGQALAPGVTPFTYTCSTRTVGTPVVCVHPAYRSALPGLTARFDALSRRLGPGTLVITELDQVPRDGTRPRPGATAFSLDRITATYMDDSVSELVQNLVDPARCPDDYTTGATTGVVGDWLAGRTTPLTDLGLDPAITPEAYTAATAFRGWDDTQKRTWLSAHWRAFTECKITPSLLTKKQ